MRRRDQGPSERDTVGHSPEASINSLTGRLWCWSMDGCYSTVDSVIII